MPSKSAVGTVSGSEQQSVLKIKVLENICLEILGRPVNVIWISGLQI